MSEATSPGTVSGSIVIEALTEYVGTDLDDLCVATEATMANDGGFGWLKAPMRHALEGYWRGVVLVPERQLFVGRLDEAIVGSAQLVRAARHNEAQAANAHLINIFVAPWARGYGVAGRLVDAIEAAARVARIEVLNTDLRDTQKAAMHLYEGRGFVRWGTHPYYARVGENLIPGHYYYKLLSPASQQDKTDE